MAIKTKTKIVKKSEPSLTQLPRFNLKTELKKNKKVFAVGIVIILIILFAFLFRSFFVAAIVNGEPITRLSVVKALEKQGGKTTLDNLITKKLILQEAKKRNVTVTKNDINAEIKKIEENVKSQGSTLDEALKTQGMTRAQLNDEIKIQLSIQKMVDKDIKVTDKEVNEFITANKDQFTEGTTVEQMKKQATAQLKQQKQQEKTQAFLADLQKKAKILHIVAY